MTEHPEQEEQEDQLAEVLQLRPFPHLGRIVGWAADMVQGRGDVQWPPPVPVPDPPAAA